MSISGRIWGVTPGPMSGGTQGCRTPSVGCPSDCYNAVYPQANGLQRPTLLTGLCVSTCVDAVRYYAEVLRRRVAARRCIVQSTSDAVFNISLRRSTKPDALITIRPASGCGYPVTIGYVDGARTAETVQFQSMDEAIDWLVEEIG